MANEGTTAQHQQALDDIRQIDEILHDDSDADEYIGSDLEIDEERDSEDENIAELFPPRPSIASSFGDVPGCAVEDQSDSDTDQDMCKAQLLLLNRQYQLYVVNNLQRVREALEKNRNLQETKLTSKKEKSLTQEYKKFLPPYFKDSFHHSPPDNEDTIAIRQVKYPIPTDHQCPRGWLKHEREKLQCGVKADGLEKIMIPLLNQREVLEKRLKDAVHQKDKVTARKVKKDISEIDNKLSGLKALPLEELLGSVDREVDWQKVASRHVSSFGIPVKEEDIQTLSGTQKLDGARTEVECRSQWQVSSHPSFKHTWTAGEEEKLKEIVQKYQSRNWEAIATDLGTGHSAHECIKKYQQKLNLSLSKRNYTSEEDQKIVELIEKFRIGKFIPWAKVCYYLQDRKPNQIAWRWETKLNPNLRFGKWQPGEDELLTKLVEKQKADVIWVKIAMEVPGRSAAQCRNRWLNSLDPALRRGRFSAAEDLILLEAIKKCGLGRWSKIASTLKGHPDLAPGRSASMFMWRFKYLAKYFLDDERRNFNKKMQVKKKQAVEEEMTSVVGGCQTDLIGLRRGQTYQEYLSEIDVSSFLELIITEARRKVEELGETADKANMSELRGNTYWLSKKDQPTMQEKTGKKSIMNEVSNRSKDGIPLSAHSNVTKYLKNHPEENRPDMALETQIIKEMFPQRTLKPKLFLERGARPIFKLRRCLVIHTEFNKKKSLSWSTALSILLVVTKVDFLACEGIIYRDNKLLGVTFPTSRSHRPGKYPKRAGTSSSEQKAKLKKQPYQLIPSSPNNPGVGEIVSGDVIGQLPAGHKTSERHITNRPQQKQGPPTKSETNQSTDSLFVVKTNDGRILLVSSSDPQPQNASESIRSQERQQETNMSQVDGVINLSSVVKQPSANPCQITTSPSSYVSNTSSSNVGSGIMFQSKFKPYSSRRKHISPRKKAAHVHPEGHAASASLDCLNKLPFNSNVSERTANSFSHFQPESESHETVIVTQISQNDCIHGTYAQVGSNVPQPKVEDGIKTSTTTQRQAGENEKDDDLDILANVCLGRDYEGQAVPPGLDEREIGKQTGGNEDGESVSTRQITNHREQQNQPLNNDTITSGDQTAHVLPPVQRNGGNEMGTCFDVVHFGTDDEDNRKELSQEKGQRSELSEVAAEEVMEVPLVALDMTIGRVIQSCGNTEEDSAMNNEGDPGPASQGNQGGLLPLPENNKGINKKCSDGIHCGTDDEEERESLPAKVVSKCNKENDVKSMSSGLEKETNDADRGKEDDEGGVKEVTAQEREAGASSGNSSMKDTDACHDVRNDSSDKRQAQSSAGPKEVQDNPAKGVQDNQAKDLKKNKRNKRTRKKGLVTTIPRTRRKAAPKPGALGIPPSDESDESVGDDGNYAKRFKSSSKSGTSTHRVKQSAFPQLEGLSGIPRTHPSLAGLPPSTKVLIGPNGDIVGILPAQNQSNNNTVIPTLNQFTNVMLPQTSPNIPMPIQLPQPQVHSVIPSSNFIQPTFIPQGLTSLPVNQVTLNCSSATPLLSPLVTQQASAAATTTILPNSVTVPGSEVTNIASNGIVNQLFASGAARSNQGIMNLFPPQTIVVLPGSTGTNFLGQQLVNPTMNNLQGLTTTLAPNLTLLSNSTVPQPLANPLMPNLFQNTTLPIGQTGGMMGLPNVTPASTQLMNTVIIPPNPITQQPKIMSDLTLSQRVNQCLVTTGITLPFTTSKPTVVTSSLTHMAADIQQPTCTNTETAGDATQQWKKKLSVGAIQNISSPLPVNAVTPNIGQGLLTSTSQNGDERPLYEVRSARSMEASQAFEVSNSISTTQVHEELFEFSHPAEDDPGGLPRRDGNGKTPMTVKNMIENKKEEKAKASGKRRKRMEASQAFEVSNSISTTQVHEELFEFSHPAEDDPGGLPRRDGNGKTPMTVKNMIENKKEEKAKAFGERRKRMEASQAFEVSNSISTTQVHEELFEFSHPAEDDPGGLPRRGSNGQKPMTVKNMIENKREEKLKASGKRRKHWRPFLSELLQDDQSNVDLQKLEEFAANTLGSKDTIRGMPLVPPNLSNLFSFKHLLIKKTSLEKTTTNFRMTTDQLENLMVDVSFSDPAYYNYLSTDAENQVSANDFLLNIRQLPIYRLFQERFIAYFLWPAFLSILSAYPSAKPVKKDKWVNNRVKRKIRKKGNGGSKVVGSVSGEDVSRDSVDRLQAGSQASASVMMGKTTKKVQVSAKVKKSKASVLVQPLRRGTRKTPLRKSLPSKD